MRKNKVQYMVKVAILGALAAVIMLLECPLPFAPPFYKLDFSEIIVLISGFALGPWAAVLTELIKTLCHMPFTQTACVGEFAAFIMGVSFALPAALIYKHKKSFKTAVLGMVAGGASLVIVGALVNYFIMIPAYVKFMGIPLNSIIGISHEANSHITGLRSLIVYATVPFNAVKAIVCSCLTALLYKRVSPILHKNFGKK